MDIKIELKGITLDNDHDQDTYDKIRSGFVTINTSGRCTISVQELRNALLVFGEEE